MPTNLLLAAALLVALAAPASAFSSAANVKSNSMAALAATQRAVARLRPAESVLLVCDVQERFRTIIHSFDAMVSGTKLLMDASAALEVPVVVTEQYPKVFGATVAELGVGDRALLLPPQPKRSFTMCTPEVKAALMASGRETVLLCGIEAHVCVQQTALDLLENGYVERMLPVVLGCAAAAPATTAVPPTCHGAYPTAAAGLRHCYCCARHDGANRRRAATTPTGGGHCY